MCSMGGISLLTIALPTYNRASRLMRALELIIPAVRSCGVGGVDILVSDNCSPDNTRAMVAEMMQAYPDVHIHYFRHSENLGMDRNFVFALKNATGRHVVLLSDDDELIVGRLSRLLDILTSLPADVPICIDHPGESKRMAVVVPDYVGFPGCKVGDSNQALEFMGSGLFFLTSTVVPTALVRGLLCPGQGTLIQLAYVFSAVISKSPKIVLDALPLVSHSGNHRVAYSLPKVLVSHYANYLNWLPSLNFDRGVVRRLISNHFRGFVLGGIVYRKSIRHMLGFRYYIGEMWGFFKEIHALREVDIISFKLRVVLMGLAVFPASLLFPVLKMRRVMRRIITS